MRFLCYNKKKLGWSYEKTYIRLGEIPADGRSVNFLKMTSIQKDAFHDAEIEGVDTRADITEECK